MKVVAVVLAAGRGERLGAEMPKAQVRILGRSLLQWSAEALGRARGVDAVLPVLHPDASPRIYGTGSEWPGPAALLEPVPGGDTRQASLARALEALARQAPSCTWVLVHDAARCCIGPEDAEAVLAAAREGGAALPVRPVSDTIKVVAGERVIETPLRSTLARALTPQAFRRELLVEALDKAARDGFVGTDCASLVERLGVPVRVVPGREENFKVTMASDLARAEALLRARERVEGVG